MTFKCDKNYNCCDYQYWNNEDDIDTEAKMCGHLIEIKEVIRGHWIEGDIEKYELSYGGYGFMPHCICSVCGHDQETYMRFDCPTNDELDYPMYCEFCGSKNKEREECKFEF